MTCPSAGREVPRSGLDDARRCQDQLPPTFRTVGGPDVIQRFVFDPSTLHYSNAYRASDPSFPDPEREEAWRAARNQALRLVLASIAGSPWAEALVLRGSVAMSFWFPESAREPGDLDFVVVPPTWGIGEARTASMLKGVAAAAQEHAEANGSGLLIDGDRAALGDIWTYDRVPGRRMVLPWAAPGLPGGDVQLDFVFNEPLPEAAEPLNLPDGAVVQAASPALSLAWKLLWLIGDMHPQGKDLYDAVLLAERYPPTISLLEKVFQASGEYDPYWKNRKVRLEDVVEAAQECELHHFVTEYPALAADSEGLAARLIAAVRPAFA